MTVHKTVLLKEAVENLNLKSGSTVVDATLGGGGHSREILEKIGESGILIGFDRDSDALNNFTEFPISNFQFPNNSQFPIFKIENIYLVNSNFSNIGNILDNLGIERVDAILADFGLSSDQLDSKERGFSFLSDADLDMRMDQGQELTAKDIVNKYSEEDLTRIFKEYGEEKYARSIAKNILKSRKEKEIKTTFDLVNIIEGSVPGEYRRQKIHFATRVFQALRIEVNKELESIEKFIREAVSRLKSEGRLAVISFHSGEDRIAKNIFKELEKGCDCPPEFPICQCGKKSQIKIITKRPIISSDDEIAENPRSRSAKLRIVEKI